MEDDEVAPSMADVAFQNNNTILNWDELIPLLLYPTDGVSDKLTL